MAADPRLQRAESPPHRAPRPRAVPAQPPATPKADGASLEELTARRLATEERWRRALKAANSGRPVDLAELALAQDEYVAAEAALSRARRDADEQSRRLALMRARQVEVQSRLAVIVAQEQRWREVANGDGRGRGLMGGLRRLFRRSR